MRSSPSRWTGCAVRSSSPSADASWDARAGSLWRHASGRDYLRARAGGSEAAQRLHERLDAIARSAVVRPGQDLLHAAYLVDQADVARFVAEVKRTQASCPELALLCTGPWPPFSFADAEPTS